MSEVVPAVPYEIDNGERLLVKVGDAEFQAGVAKIRGVTEIAFRPMDRPPPLETPVFLRGKEWRILSATKSDIPHMVVLTIEPKA